MAWLLCLVMVVSCLPLGALAAALGNFDTDGDFDGVKLSVIGDSISTYYGVTNSSTYNPLYLVTSEATFGTYYGNTSHGSYSEFSDVTRADTWWQQTVDTLGLDLLVNNAWSGSYVLKDNAQGNTTEYGAAAYKDRSVNLHMGSEMPDIIAVYLGTNDVANYSSTDVGSKADVDTAGERSALYTSVNSFATPATSIEAYFIMLSRMLEKYPEAEIYCMLPTICLATMSSGRQNALDSFNAGVKYLVEYFAGQGKTIYLVDLDSDSGLNTNDTVKNYYYCNNVHPSVEGMDWITSCVISEILEHSRKGQGNAVIHEVSYDLQDAFVTTGLTRRTVKGEPFRIDLEPYETYQDIRLTVTMTDAATGEAVEIPGLGTSGDSVYIPEVKGPITVTAVADKADNYHWSAASNGLISNYGPEFSFNDSTLVSGTYTSDGAMTDVQYSLGEPVLLQADKPWELEFRGGGNTFAGGIMLLTDTTDASTSGNVYIHINQSNVLFGYRDSVGYNNSGIAWTTIAEKIGSSAGAGVRQEIHTYRFVNEVSASGNMLRLYVDGVDIGTMDQVKLIGSSATHASASSVDISGKDFLFHYIGASNFPLRYCTMEYIKVWENGQQPVEVLQEDMRWEMNGAGDAFASVDDDENYRENALTLLGGSVSGGTFNDVTYQLHRPVILMHDETWKITWGSEGDWAGSSNGAMLLATSINYKGVEAPYLYRRQGSEFIAFGAWDGSVHANYGIRLADYGIDGTVHHKYELVNEIEADGTNMVYLYVDDVKIGALDNYYEGGASTSSVKSDWISGKDLRFSYIGTTEFPVGGCGIDYLQVSVACQHEFSDWTTVDATCTADGSRTRTCQLCQEVETEVIGAAGHDHQAYLRAATCQDFAHTEYICANCGDSYKVYDDAIMGDWVEVLPEGIDESRIQIKVQYRYSDYETTTSYETALDGYTLKSSAWEQSGTGTISYVDSWTTGFDTGSSLYGQYNKKSSKVTASETDTTKTVIDSDAVAGYLYHHWCYSGSYYSKQATTGSYTTFHAFYSTTAPSSLSNYDDTDGSYYYPNSSACSNSDWWWPTTVNAQKYTTYKKLFTYERWGDWSDWSDTAVTASDTRKVETRTVYRYADGMLGDHDFVEGSCTVCGTGCTHSTHDQTGTCLACGGTVAHSYSGVVTAPGCTADGYTTYTCDGCGYSYVADPVSAAGHSYDAGSCTVCGMACPHEWDGDSCGICGMTCQHSWANHVCTVCGQEYPRKDYYLFGYIDGADYACNDDYENLGIYRFVDGKLTAVFQQDSYVAVKSGDNQDWYMTKSYMGEDATAGTLYNTSTGASEKLFVPGGKVVTFHLVHNGNDTFTLSFVAEECEHESHDAQGSCTVCGQTVEHSYTTAETKPTCVNGGSVVYTCTVCGHSYTETVPATGHTYDGVVTEPTCTEAGYTTYTCASCGDSYTGDTVAAPGHSYSGGVCTGCGAADPDALADPGLALSYPTLSFEDEIFYNVYYTVGDTTNVEEMGLMLLPAMMADATIQDATALIPGYVTNGVAYMARSEGIAAAYMGDTVYFKVYAKLTDGSYAYSNAGGYNAKAYSNTILSGDYADEMKSLVVAMVNYGAEAQLYFGHNTDKLVNAALTDEQKALVASYDESMVDAVVSADSSKTANFVRVNSNFSSLYPSVSFDGAFSINFYCTPAITVDSGMTLYWWDAETYASIDGFTVDNATGSMEMTESNGQYWGNVAGIAAKEMDKTYYVSCVFESEGETITTGIIAYSLGKYCEGKAATDGDAQQAFAQATAVYGYYAKQYFASIA